MAYLIAREMCFTPQPDFLLLFFFSAFLFTHSQIPPSLFGTKKATFTPYLHFLIHGIACEHGFFNRFFLNFLAFCRLYRSDYFFTGPGKPALFILSTCLDTFFDSLHVFSTAERRLATAIPSFTISNALMDSSEFFSSAARIPNKCGHKSRTANTEIVAFSAEETQA